MRLGFSNGSGWREASASHEINEHYCNSHNRDGVFASFRSRIRPRFLARLNPKEHAKRVSVTIRIRNGDGNFLDWWSGHWFDAGLGADGEIEAAAVRSFLDAVEHKSTVLKSEKTYPHRD